MARSRRRVASADRAHAGAVPRVPPRARGGVLGVRVPGDHDVRARRGVPLARRPSRSSSGSSQRRRRGRQTAAALETAGGFTVRPIAPDDVERAVRDGRAPVVVVPGTPPAYRFDEARAESQAARLAVDAALQRAAGRDRRVRAASSSRSSRRLALHRLAGAGAARHEHHGHRPLGRRLLDRRGATASCSSGWSRRRCRGPHYLASHVFSRLLFLALEAVVHRRLRLACLRRRRARLVSPRWRCSRCSGRWRSAGWGCSWRAARGRSKAVSGLMNLVMLPMWVLSGVFFASSNFPDAMQPFIQALPLTALNDALRGVMNEGASLAGTARRDRDPRRLGHASRSRWRSSCSAGSETVARAYDPIGRRISDPEQHTSASPIGSRVLRVHSQERCELTAAPIGAGSVHASRRCRRRDRCRYSTDDRASCCRSSGSTIGQSTSTRRSRLRSIRSALPM